MLIKFGGKMKKRISIQLIFLLLSSILFAKPIKIFSQFNYYTDESIATIMIKNLSAESFIQLKMDEIVLAEKKITSETGEILLILNKFEIGKSLIDAEIFRKEKLIKTIEFPLVKLESQDNEVKINNETGGLFVDGLPYFPFGFYCYSPVQKGLPAEEVVKGFNLISPYQKIIDSKFEERKAYMDRCRELGMKVHFNLCSVSGGGGVGSGLLKKITEEQRIELLKKEILAFKNHPALLGWYISDEPAYAGTSSDLLVKYYEIIKEIDPYHPITIVFMRPKKAKKYVAAMDIVMADPYPIPHSNVADVTAITENLYKEFEYEKPIWIVPQAFGGNEWWMREPTQQELRVMTYLSIINNATGIQYFIRKGLNGFPKSTSTWAECGMISLEIAQLTPFLLDYDSQPKVSVSLDDLQINAWKKGDETIILIANEKNQPCEFNVTFESVSDSGNIEVLFENRNIKSKENSFTDIIDALGTRAYKLVAQNNKTHKKTDNFNEENLVFDSNFEKQYAPGVPPYCYAYAGSDKGSTYFIDSRISYEGNNSLRLTTPTFGKGTLLSFWPISLEKNQSYTISVFGKENFRIAKPIIKRNFFQRIIDFIFRRKFTEEPFNFKLELGRKHKKYFDISGDWKEYSFSVITSETDGKLTKINPRIELIGHGSAWFDKLEVYPNLTINDSINKVKKQVEVEIKTTIPNAKIHYSLDGESPTIESKIYKKSIVIEKSSFLKVAIFKENQIIAYTEKEFNVHLGVAKKISIKNHPNKPYNDGGKYALIDGIKGSKNFRDSKWQGFNGQNLEAIIDLEKKRTISSISIGFLQNKSSWIFLPNSVEIFTSNNGKAYKRISRKNKKKSHKSGGTIIENFKFNFNNIQARYIKIKGNSVIYCPKWHKGAGKSAWMFVDEIVIE